MRIKPNRVTIEGRLVRLLPAADGFGADVEVEVSGSAPAGDLEDFLGAAPGSTIILFAAEPAGLETGRRYRITASVLGGPGGERAVIERAEPL